MKLCPFCRSTRYRIDVTILGPRLFVVCPYCAGVLAVTSKSGLRIATAAEIDGLCDADRRSIRKQRRAATLPPKGGFLQ